MAIHEDWLNDNGIRAFILDFTLIYGLSADLRDGIASISEEDKNLVDSAHRKIIDMGLSEEWLISYNAAEGNIPHVFFMTFK
jgi:hypothetical protein